MARHPPDPHETSQAPEAAQGPPTQPNDNVQERRSLCITRRCPYNLTIAISIVGLGFGLSILYNDEHFGGTFGAASSCPIFAIALVWSSAEQITRSLRNCDSGVHPGAHAGVSLVLLLACIIFGGGLIHFINRFLDVSYCDLAKIRYNFDYCIDMHAARARFIGVTTLLLLLWLVQLIIFVNACSNIAKRSAIKLKRDFLCDTKRRMRESVY